MGVFFTRQERRFTEGGENDRIGYAASSTIYPHENKIDVHAAVPDLDDITSFFGVYDDHGDEEVALFCAKQFHTEFHSHKDYDDRRLLPTAMRSVFLRMDGLLKRSDEWKKSLHPGSYNLKRFLRTVGSALTKARPQESESSACIAVIRAQINVGNVGSSCCVASRNGQAIILSTDHDPINWIEEERIQGAGGQVTRDYISVQEHGLYHKKREGVARINGVLAVSRAIGDFAFKQNEDLNPQRVVTCEPSVQSFAITNDVEFIVIASGDIWFCMESQTLLDIVGHYTRCWMDDRTICKRPCGHGTGSLDNSTAILVRCKDAPPPSLVPTDDYEKHNKEKTLSTFLGTALDTHCLKLLIQYGRLPVEVAAVWGTREDFEILFPFTSPIPTVTNPRADVMVNHVELEKKELEDDEFVEMKESEQKTEDAFKKQRYSWAWAMLTITMFIAMLPCSLAATPTLVVCQPYALAEHLVTQCAAGSQESVRCCDILVWCVEEAGGGDRLCAALTELTKINPIMTYKALVHLYSRCGGVNIEPIRRHQCSGGVPPLSPPAGVNAPLTPGVYAFAPPAIGSHPEHHHSIWGSIAKGVLEAFLAAIVPVLGYLAYRLGKIACEWIIIGYIWISIRIRPNAIVNPTVENDSSSNTGLELQSLPLASADSQIARDASGLET